MRKETECSGRLENLVNTMDYVQSRVIDRTDFGGDNRLSVKTEQSLEETTD